MRFQMTIITIVTVILTWIGYCLFKQGVENIEQHRIRQETAFEQLRRK